ncbi:plasmid recombination protein [Ruegeria arenilitoris]|uniref:plasmid recombination protein n=1 Tax=Ruegeria arenilitoris TaxID=1173585 RepID=UPI0014817B7A|nr:plasmid recombination protein [Ruegeria arenilitoris]
MGDTKFSCVRIQKIRSAVDARNATKHGRRERGAFGKSRVDLERSHLNLHWRFDADLHELKLVDECPDYREALEARRDQLGARRPKNGTFGTEMLFTASPSLFRRSCGDVDLEIAKVWARSCLDLAEARYSGMCVAARLDLDETTPHLSVFILPTYEKSYGGEKRQSKRKPRRTVSHNKVFGGPEQLSMLQDWLADGLKEQGFCVERGLPVEVTRARNFRPDGAIYQKLKDWWGLLKKREAELDRKEARINERLNTVLRKMRVIGKVFQNDQNRLSEPAKEALKQIFAMRKFGSERRSSKALDDSSKDGSRGPKLIP